MDWNDNLWIVILLVAVNTLLALGMLIYGLTNKKGRRGEIIMFSVLVFICPLVLPLCLMFIGAFERFTQSREVDMNEISFNQQREKIPETPDYMVEMDYVSIKDAMRLSSVTDQRRLLINVMKYGTHSALSSMVDAINSPDTETSHFAATAIQDALSEFRTTSQKLIANMQRYPEDVEINLSALEFIYNGLQLKIMTPIETQSYVYTENTVAENLFDHNIWFMTATHYLWMTILMVEVKDFNWAQRWVDRAMTYRPRELDSYKAALRLTYASGDKQGFLGYIEQFRHSALKADQELLELLRLYPSSPAKQNEERSCLPDETTS